MNDQIIIDNESRSVIITLQDGDVIVAQYVHEPEPTNYTDGRLDFYLD